MDDLTLEDESTTIARITRNKSPNDAVQYPQRLKSSANDHPVPIDWPYNKGNTLLMAQKQHKIKTKQHIKRKVYSTSTYLLQTSIQLFNGCKIQSSHRGIVTDSRVLRYDVRQLVNSTRVLVPFPGG